MNTAYIFSIFLLLLAVILLTVFRKKSTETLGIIIAILALIAAVAVFFVPAASPPDPFIITIQNQLKLPVTIVIDGKPEANLPAERTKTYQVTSSPVDVHWAVINAQTQGGNSLGDYMGGTFRDVTSAEPIIIDNDVNRVKYYLVQVTNNTNTKCSVTHDFNQRSAQPGEIKPIVNSHSSSPLGYYQLHDKSNIFFECGDKTYYWSYKTAAPIFTVFGYERLIQEISPPSGLLQLTVND